MIISDGSSNIDLDAEFERITDPALIRLNVKKGEERYHHLSKSQWLGLRRRSKTDLFFLAYGVLSYTRLSVGLHGHLCNWYQSHNTSQFREVLLPRGHFKSTVITKADSIQTVLPDDVGDQSWPRNLGTDARLCLVHETHDSASRFLFEITGHFTNNPILMGLFPECVPNPKKNRINKQELELPRTRIWSEPTIDTMGVGARGQGRHYNKIMLDDLIGDKARDSATEMETAKNWFDNVQSFFSNFALDQFVLVGTRWAFDDLYAHAHKMYEEQLQQYIRSVEERNSDGVMETIFPEEFSQARLKILRKNRVVFSAQYANDPKEGATEFSPSWLKSFYWTGRDSVVLFDNDEDNKPKREHFNIMTDMDRLILIDPALTGAGGYVVTGTTKKKLNFILKSLRLEKKTEEFIPFLFQEVLRWKPRAVVIEKVLFSALYKPFLEAEMKLRGQRFFIMEAETKQKAKEARIRGLANYWSSGQIITDENQSDLMEEYNTFGASGDIHILDALAYGPEFWRSPGGVMADVEELMKEDEEDSERDLETGYSAI